MLNITNGESGNKGYHRRNTEKDLWEIYSLCERRLHDGCFYYDPIAMRNAFQVVRYAFREWGVGKRPERVLNALMYASPKIKKEEKLEVVVGDSVIFCEDAKKAKQIEEILRGEGYEEESTDC